MNLPAEIHAQFVTCKPLYSRFKRFLGMGSKMVDIYVATSSTARFKLVTLSSAGRKSDAARASFARSTAHIARLKDVAAAPDIFFADEETIVVNWVDGAIIHQALLTERLSAQLAVSARRVSVRAGNRALAQTSCSAKERLSQTVATKKNKPGPISVPLTTFGE